MKSDAEWRKQLSDEAYHVLREKGTELPFTGKFLKHDKNGMYSCGACDAVLFKSTAKYESDTPGLAGWPSFSEVASSDAVEIKEDRSGGMQRLEVICANCKSHLGHVFKDDDSPTGIHYCINSVALNFKGDKK
jgi:peptide-methionine (R)-S-oxide reductase